MKTKLALLTAVLAPLTLSAQNPEATSGIAAADVRPAAAQAPPAPPTRLSRVQFQDATLAEIVEYIQAKAQEMGLDPNVNPLNVVITPGLGIEDKRVPSISLRNVSPTEVLTVVTTVLGLHLEPVTGDDGQPVAWLVKVTEVPGAPSPVATGISGAETGAAGGSLAGPPGTTDPTASVTPPGLSGGRSGLGSGVPVSPKAVELASSPVVGGGGGGGGGFATAQAKQVRVFGIASLINSREGNRDDREKFRTHKYNQLVETLTIMSADQSGTSADVKFYEAMDIIVVKTADPVAMTLISDAIEAMKKNATAGGETATAQVQEVAQAREASMRAEMETLKGQLRIAEAEREMTRRTFTDQIEALKSAQKAQNTERKPER